MSKTEEIIQACNALPEDKQIELVDFARFLLSRQADDAWERTLAQGKKSPKFDAFLREVAAEADEPLDPSKL